MEKIVKSGERIAAAELDGSECAVIFSSKYRGFEVRNNSGGDIIVSLQQGVSEGDGVVTVPDGEGINYMHDRMISTVYITGSGTVLIAAQNDTAPVFLTGSKSKSTEVRIWIS